MTEFTYSARNLQGERVDGLIAAASEREAIAQLSSRSLFPLEVREKLAAARTLRPTRRVSGEQMATCYGQLAALLRSGVPLLRALTVLRDQTSHVGLQAVLSDVHDQVEEGIALPVAMQCHPRTFRPMAISMARAGNEGGFLEDALDRVAAFTEQEADLKSRTMGALAYPVFLCVVGTIVVAVLMIFFVPSFGQMFDDLRERGELPMMTDVLLTFSNGLRQWSLLLAIGAALAFAAGRNYLATEQGQRQKDLWKLKLPLLGSIFQSLAVARFCRVLGTLLHNGVPILTALDISRTAAGNRLLAEAVGAAAENISAGQSLGAPLASSGYFPPSVVEMIAVAEESNTLERVLVDIADGLERRTARRLDLMVRLLEPVMLLILAGIVLVIVLALLLPVLKMSSTL